MGHSKNNIYRRTSNLNPKNTSHAVGIITITIHSLTDHNIYIFGDGLSL